MSERPFRTDTQRMPIWGLGYAGGATSLARANDWLGANPDKTVLLVSCKLCSLTFQKIDLKKSNIVGSALIGDGAEVALMMGKHSKYISHRP